MTTGRFTVPGCCQTAAAAINDKNEVVGTTTCGGIATAFIRDAIRRVY